MNLAQYKVHFDGVQRNRHGKIAYYQFTCYAGELESYTFATKRLSHLAILLKLWDLRHRVRQAKLIDG